MRKHASGFTLLEMIVAISLIATILVMAFGTIRLLTKAMGVVSEIREDGELLRQGLLFALDDADFWNSSANPDPPWCASYNSDLQVDSSGIVKSDATPVDDAGNKRIFRRVAFSATDQQDVTFSGLVPNPNVLLPHDQRSWYRGHLFSNIRPFDNRRGRYNATRQSNQDLYLISAYIYRDYWSGVPAEWSPLQVYGDYALISHTEMSEATDPGPYVDEVLTDRIAGPGGYRPNAFLNLYRVLGTFGILSYAPRGSLLLVQRHDRLRGPSIHGGTGAMGTDPAALLIFGSSTRADTAKFYDMGEVPWAMDVGTSLASVTTDYLGNIQVYPPSLASVKNSLDYSKMLFGNIYDPPSAWRQACTSYALCDMDVLLLGANGRNDLSLRQSSWSMYPTIRPINGYGKLSIPCFWTNPRNGIYSCHTSGNYLGSGIFSDYLPDNQIETQLIPLSPSGSTTVATTSIFENRGKAMRISIFRLCSQGRNIDRVGSVVIRPDGRRLLLLCNSLGTDLRGARQHWGMIRTDMGDAYQ